MEKEKIKSTSKYPTTLLVKGLTHLGIEVANRLVEQGGYVVIVDTLTPESQKLLDEVKNKSLLTVLDMSAISSIESDIRRLDYVFFFSHEVKNFINEISSQEFLQQSNYLDQVLDISIKFNARFLLTTSIKAHQLLIESKNMELTTASDIIPQYSETEIQRYAENLVLEYTKKLSLDSRIIRVGELLGKGLNPSTDSAYLDLILGAIEGKPLIIRGDGLETDFYVHYIDAARGLIQSMFSMNTKGKTYSLSIPEEISLLSIAYKVADIEPNSGEIKFAEYDGKLPPLRLYKPAVNLTAIGWVNKVSINRSIAQSIDFLKELAKEKKNEEIDEGFDEFEDKTPATTDAQGALARLISERKYQEKNRLGSVVVANENLRKKMGQGQFDLKKKVSMNAFWIFESVKHQFGFLKKITLKEFIFGLVLIFVFGIIYVFVLSPFLNIAATVYQINSSINGAKLDVVNMNYESAANKLEQTTKDIGNVQDRLNDINFLFVLSGRREEYSKYQSSLEVQRDYAEGMYITLNALTPLYQYLKSPNIELIGRLSDTSSLVEVKQNSDAILINEIIKNEAQVKLGVEKLKLNSKDIVNSLDMYPAFWTGGIKTNIEELNRNIQGYFDLERNYKFISSLLGKDKKVNYLTIIQDNTSYTAGGGEYAGYIITSFENGIITNIEINTADKLPADAINLEKIELEELNLVSTRNTVGSQVSFTDTTLIKDLDIRSLIAKKYFEEIKAMRIDAVSWINLSGMKELMGFRGVQVENVSLNSENFDASLNTLINNNNTRFRKNEVITKVFTEILIDSINNQKLIYDLSIISGLIDQNNLSFYSNDLALKSFFKGLAGSEYSGDSISFGASSDGEISSVFPQLTITGDIIVRNDGTTSKNLQVKGSSLSNLESVWTCFPAGSKNFASPNINPSLVSRNFNQDSACQIFLPNDTGEYNVAFETISFENSPNSIYNYSLKLFKPSGIEVQYEIEFSFESTKNIQPETNPKIARINNYTYSGVLDSDLIFNFTENGQ